MKRDLVHFISSRHVSLSCILLLFVLAQGYLASVHTFPTTRQETDGIGYMSHASGQLFQAHAFHGPGYPWAIRLIQSLTGLSLFTSAQSVSILAGMLFIYSVYRTFSLTDGHRSALVAALLTALTPIVLQYSSMVMSDMLAGALLWTTMWALTRTGRPQSRSLFIAGALAGLAYLTRYIYIVLVLIPPLFLLAQGWNKRNLVALLGFYAGFCLVVFPWAVFLTYTKGSPFWNLNHLNIAFKMYRGAEGWNAFPSTEQFPSIGAVISSNPVFFLKSWFQTLSHLPLAALGQISRVGVPLAIVGLVVWIATLTTRKIVIAVSLLGYGTLASLVWLEPRFLIPLMPFVAICISRAIETAPWRITIESPKTRKLSIRTIPLRLPLMAAVVIAMGAASRHLPSWFMERQANEYMKVVEWLKVHGAHHDTAVMAAKPHIPFFVGATFMNFRAYGLQSKNLDELETTLAKVQPDYFVYDERYAAVEFPQLRSLLQPDKVPHFLRPELVQNTPKRVIVFRYMGENTD